MLVALHGFTETDQSWQDVFARSALPLHCPLLPGHGWSPCREDSTVSGAAEQLAGQLSEDGSDTLMGYSMGGRVALQLALAHPRRIARLILISCRPGIEDPTLREDRRGRDERLAEILEEDGIGPFVAWWERQPVLRSVRNDRSEATEELRCRRLNQDPLGLASALRRLGQGTMTPLWDRLGELTMPSLLVVGGSDAAYLTDMQRMADAMPDARLEVFPETGHAVHREWPERLVDTVEAFLAETGAERSA